MAEFKCFRCGFRMRTGEKFIFTNKGAVHFGCFEGERMSSVSKEKEGELRSLVMVMDSELQHLVNLLSIEIKDDKTRERMKTKIKEIEKAVTLTTNEMLAL